MAAGNECTVKSRNTYQKAFCRCLEVSFDDPYQNAIVIKYFTKFWTYVYRIIQSIYEMV